MKQGNDISNHQGAPASYENTPWYNDAEFIISQAIPKPQWPGLTGAQLRHAGAWGKAKGIYTWLWHNPVWRLGDSSVTEDQRVRLSCVPDDVPLDMRPWLDVEDNQSTGWANVTVWQRIQDVNEALAILDSWADMRGLPEAGIYTSRWFIDLLFDGVDYWPARKKWLADYGPNPHPNPGFLLGGNNVIHQYGTKPWGIDMNIMVDEEIITAPVEPPAEDPCAAYKAAIERAVNRLSPEIDRKPSMRKTVIRDIANELFNAL